MSFGGLVREAVFRALDDAHMTMADIDAVVLGKAPDLFEGVMKPELYLSDALGAVGKPMFRVHTAGSVGGTTGVVAASHVQAGKHKTRARRRVREAVGGQRPVRPRQRQGRLARRRRLVRPVHPRPTSTAAARPSTSAGRSR